MFLDHIPARPTACSRQNVFPASADKEDAHTEKQEPMPLVHDFIVAGARKRTGSVLWVIPAKGQVGACAKGRGGGPEIHLADRRVDA